MGERNRKLCQSKIFIKSSHFHQQPRKTKTAKSFLSFLRSFLWPRGNWASDKQTFCIFNVTFRSSDCHDQYLWWIFYHIQINDKWRPILETPWHCFLSIRSCLVDLFLLHIIFLGICAIKKSLLVGPVGPGDFQLQHPIFNFMPEPLNKNYTWKMRTSNNVLGVLD